MLAWEGCVRERIDASRAKEVSSQAKEAANIKQIDPDAELQL